jgi:hypothetical protein
MVSRGVAKWSALNRQLKTPLFQKECPPASSASKLLCFFYQYTIQFLQKQYAHGIFDSILKDFVDIKHQFFDNQAGKSVSILSKTRLKVPRKSSGYANSQTCYSILCPYAYKRLSEFGKPFALSGRGRILSEENACSVLPPWAGRCPGFTGRRQP